jgi:hypothetical protein
VSKYVELAKRAKDPDNWLVIDMADRLWEWAQYYFIEKTKGMPAAEFLLTNDVSDNDYGAEWSKIKAQYASLITNILRFPGHIFLCTPVRVFTASTEKDSYIKSTFGRYGLRPEGEKRIAHMPHSILLTAEEVIDQGRRSEWKMTTIKDRETTLENMSGKIVRDFAVDYMIQVAGWRVVQDQGTLVDES